MPPGQSTLVLPVKQLYVGEKSRPGRMLIVWNDRSDDGKKFVCRAHNFRTGAKRTLPRPIYDLSPDGGTALTHDFERMNLFH